MVCPFHGGQHLACPAAAAEANSLFGGGRGFLLVAFGFSRGAGLWCFSAELGAESAKLRGECFQRRGVFGILREVGEFAGIGFHVVEFDALPAVGPEIEMPLVGP